MILYDDYCPRVSLSDRSSDKATTTFQDALSSYIEAEWSYKKLRDEADQAAKGQRYNLGLQQEFRKLILEEILPGEYRVFKVGNQAVVLDYQRDELSINFATIEKK